MTETGVLGGGKRDGNRGGGPATLRIFNQLFGQRVRLCPGLPKGRRTGEEGGRGGKGEVKGPGEGGDKVTGERGEQKKQSGLRKRRPQVARRAWHLRMRVEHVYLLIVEHAALTP